MGEAISAGRERRIRCFVCKSNVPESLTEPVKLSKDVVVNACKSHELEAGYQGDLG